MGMKKIWTTLVVLGLVLLCISVLEVEGGSMASKAAAPKAGKGADAKGGKGAAAKAGKGADAKGAGLPIMDGVAWWDNKGFKKDPKLLTDCKAACEKKFGPTDPYFAVKDICTRVGGKEVNWNFCDLACDAFHSKGTSHRLLLVLRLVR